MAIIRLKKKMHPAQKFLLILAALLLAAGLFGMWFEKTFRMDLQQDVKVLLIGENARYTEEEIRAYVFDARFKEYSILLKWYYRSHEVVPPLYLEKITVEVEDGGTVLIKAYEKNPIGALWEMGNYLYFDSDGMIVSTRKENVEGLPVVKGLTYTSVTLGKTFETQNPALFHVIMNLVRQLEKQQVAADTILFGRNNSVTLYCGGNVVELGIRDAYDVQIQVLHSMLEEIEKTDVRYHINMENVYDGTESVIATVIKDEDEGSGGGDDGTTGGEGGEGSENGG